MEDTRKHFRRHTLLNVAITNPNMQLTVKRKIHEHQMRWIEQSSGGFKIEV